MLEIYLFVNPLGGKCLASERTILKLARELPEKISYQFIPLLSMQMGHTHNASLAERNQAYQDRYRTILDYKAALFQGKKRGRQFLIRLQDTMIENELSYSEDLATLVADATHLDMDMFLEDRHSEIARKSFITDQRLAAEMGIQHPSTAVFYNALSEDAGLKVEEISYPIVKEVCESQGFSINEAQEEYGSRNNFRVL
ncbi:dithiol-disulfide isomerase [Secundilactobacillus oryzae JCM 18671]|uniref:Dithiol-disulfide isomerase n=1 Tax=Secundilactobacillus oryzae JCM 18671 TaxID=1291743 RepID=A0A081BGK2_9LACO|nr:DsbA family protein [Secundilactobacillus oryzae]GAK47170.1 dithiol-disulfide isomerase [Secundilactobacillus oryzae JCM 18671]